MSYKYIYPVVDRALRNFLMFVFVLIALIALATTLGAGFELIDLPIFYENIGPFESISGVDTATIDAETMEASARGTTAHYEFEF